MNVWLMILGRFIFGLGGESLNISTATLLMKWFKGSEISFSQAIFLSFVRLASIQNAWSTPKVATAYGTDMALLFGFFIGIASTVAAIALAYMDILWDK